MRRNSSIPERIRWGALAVGLTFVAALFLVTSGAQATVVNDNGTMAGVALIPGASLPSGVSASTTGGPCTDPWLAGDFGGPVLPSDALCYRGGSVMHSNETFALTWDPMRRYWATTRGYVEQFLGDVAAGSGSLNSPYADVPQYQDASGRAGNTSRYGGGCVDFGSVGGFSCQLGSWNGSGTGSDYPANGCPVTGQSWNWGMYNNDICLTDSQLQGELTSAISQSALLGRTQPGYTPLVVLLMPPGVETCLDSSGTLCSANSGATGQFCSYHSQVNVGGTDVNYVVQPWTPYTGCDEPNMPALPASPTPQQLAIDAGSRMVNPLSQSHIAAITDPSLNGWVSLSGGEVEDFAGCPLGSPSADTVPVGSTNYVLRREGNNAGALADEPNTYFGCVPNVFLIPTFVVPSAVNAGDVVALDGSATASTLLVPKANYAWDFGDGTSAVGPSVEHTYGKGGTFNVKLTTTDRGGNVQTLVQQITVLGANGLPVPPTNPPTTNPSNTGSKSGLQVRMQLMPEALRLVLRRGITVAVSANEPANGIAQVSISRATAKHVHIKAGHGRSVVIGTGTLSSIKNGTVMLHLHLSGSTVTKLKHLKHVTLTVRLALVAAGGAHLAIDAAGRY